MPSTRGASIASWALGSQEPELLAAREPVAQRMYEQAELVDGQHQRTAGVASRARSSEWSWSATSARRPSTALASSAAPA